MRSFHLVSYLLAKHLCIGLKGIMFSNGFIENMFFDYEQAKRSLFTKREGEVLLLLAKGMTREEIATKLFISDETVKMHTRNIYKKLKAKNKGHVLIKAKMM